MPSEAGRRERAGATAARRWPGRSGAAPSAAPSRACASTARRRHAAVPWPSRRRHTSSRRGRSGAESWQFVPCRAGASASRESLATELATEFCALGRAFARRQKTRKCCKLLIHMDSVGSPGTPWEGEKSCFSCMGCKGSRVRIPPSRTIKTRVSEVIGPPAPQIVPKKLLLPALWQGGTRRWGRPLQQWCRLPAG